MTGITRGLVLCSLLAASLTLLGCIFTSSTQQATTTSALQAATTTTQFAVVPPANFTTTTATLQGTTTTVTPPPSNITAYAQACVNQNLTAPVYEGYNPNSDTYWFTLNDSTGKYPGCDPACVVFANGSTEINYRCTGAIVPTA